MKQLVISLFSFFILGAGAQTRTMSLSIYYAIDQVEALDRFVSLDSLHSLLQKEKYAVEIIGYADYLSSDAYNADLSLRRALRVKKHLTQKNAGPVLDIQRCEGRGEKNSKPGSSIEGDASQRRVDVVFKEQFYTKPIGTRENVIHADSSPVQTTKTPPVKTTSQTNIEALEKGESITVEGLNFIPGRHIPVKASIPVLEKLLQTLKEHPKLKIEIQGHICCIYDSEDGFDYDTRDMHLSTNRALTVYNYLVKNGIDKSRLTYKGYGRSQPKIAIERTPEDEQANRRVDIKILEN